MRNKLMSSVVLVMFMLLPGVLWAHEGQHQAQGLAAGMMHMLMGIDHVLIMLLAGLWAVMTRRQSVMIPMLVFPSLLLVGIVAGMFGLAVPYMHAAISVLVFAMACLLALRIRLGALQTSIVLGLFALLQGAAHGGAIAGTVDGLVYVAGFMAIAVLLQVSGAMVGHTLRNIGSVWGHRAAALLMVILGLMAAS